MRGADALVAVLHPDGEAHRVLNTEAAPGRTHTALHRTERFAVSMATFETGIDQVFPDVGKLIHPGTEQVDPLTAGDLGIEFVFLSDLTQHDELVGRDFSAGDSGHDGVKSLALNIGHETIIGVLNRIVIAHMFIPEAGENRSDGRLADFAAVP